MAQRPAVVACDVLETLFPLVNLEQRFLRAGLPPETVAFWFDRVLRDGFALTLAGRFETFQAVGESALTVLLKEAGLGGAERAAREVVAGLSELDAHPDVAPAARRLRGAGLRLIALTNGSTAATEALLSRAGLSGDFEDVVSIDDAGRWKPAREVYLYAADACGVSPAEVALLSAHSWDIQGAKSAGLTTAWVRRRERLLDPLIEAPDVRGETLGDAATALLSLPAAPAGSRRARASGGLRRKAGRARRALKRAAGRVA